MSVYETAQTFDGSGKKVHYEIFAVMQSVIFLANLKADFFPDSK